MNPPVVKSFGDALDGPWQFRLLHQFSQFAEGSLLSANERSEFDAARLRLVQVLRQCNDARRELSRLVEEHIVQVASGHAVYINNAGVLVIQDDIEPRLNRLVNSFFVPARTALYHLCGQKDVGGKASPGSILQILTGFNFGFVFIFDPKRFEREAQKYMDAYPGVRSTTLIETLRSDRETWTLALQEIRDKIIHDTDHDGLKMLYRPNGQTVTIGFPTLNQIPMLDFIERFWMNLIEFCEEAMVLALNTRMPPLIAIDRIPENERTADLPYYWRGILLEKPIV